MKHLVIELNDELRVEVEYNAWGETKSNDYDVPNDPSGFEVGKIILYIDKEKFDVTEVLDDLCDALNFRKIEEAIEKEITNP